MRLHLAVHELDEKHVGTFSFRSEEAIMKVRTNWWWWVVDTFASNYQIWCAYQLLAHLTGHAAPMLASFPCHMGVGKVPCSTQPGNEALVWEGVEGQKACMCVARSWIIVLSVCW